MYDEKTEEFIASAKPLFRKRRIWGLLFGIFTAIVVIAFKSPGEAAAITLIICIPIYIFVISRLVNCETTLENNIWNWFIDKSRITTIDGRDPRDFRISAAPLQGVIGTIGHGRSVLPIMEGVCNGYPIRILDETVYFDPTGQKYAKTFRIFEITTNQYFYHVYIDSKSNGRPWMSSAMTVLQGSFKKADKLDVEGDVHKYFNIYVPPHSTSDSLMTLTPDKLIALRDFGTKFDVEFIDNYIYVIAAAKLNKVEDILMYQENVIGLLTNIGAKIIRDREIQEDPIPIDPPIFMSWS